MNQDYVVAGAQVATCKSWNRRSQHTAAEWAACLTACDTCRKFLAYLKVWANEIKLRPQVAKLYADQAVRDWFAQLQRNAMIQAIQTNQVFATGKTKGVTPGEVVLGRLAIAKVYASPNLVNLEGAKKSFQQAQERCLCEQAETALTFLNTYNAQEASQQNVIVKLLIAKLTAGDAGQLAQDAVQAYLASSLNAQALQQAPPAAAIEAVSAVLANSNYSIQGTVSNLLGSPTGSSGALAVVAPQQRANMEDAIQQITNILLGQRTPRSERQLLALAETNERAREVLALANIYQLILTNHQFIKLEDMRNPSILSAFLKVATAQPIGTQTPYFAAIAGPGLQSLLGPVLGNLPLVPRLESGSVNAPLPASQPWLVKQGTPEYAAWTAKEAQETAARETEEAESEAEEVPRRGLSPRERAVVIAVSAVAGMQAQEKSKAKHNAKAKRSTIEHGRRLGHHANASEMVSSFSADIHGMSQRIARSRR